MRPGELIADIDRHGVALAESLLAAIGPARGACNGVDKRRTDIAAHQLLWRHYMVTGDPACGAAVIASLRADCRAGGAVEPTRDATFVETAQMLELLTWVWRQCRCPQLRRRAEDLAGGALARPRVAGFGLAASPCDRRDDAVHADQDGLMLVALIEAGSVLERRDCLAAAREMFDEIVARVGDGAGSGAGLHDATGGRRRGDADGLDDYATMSRAAIRLFEAFGKRRYIEHAQAWVARLDAAFWEPAHGGYRPRAGEAAPAASVLGTDLPSGNALMIGVLARLHALTHEPRYADRAERLVAAHYHAIKRSGAATATAIACCQTLARPVVITVAGDPKLVATRELMRIALDCGLPDRIVLGPGAGDPSNPSPRASVRLGAHRLAPVTDTARLRSLVAPGGFRQAV